MWAGKCSLSVRKSHFLLFDFTYLNRGSKSKPHARNPTQNPTPNPNRPKPAMRPGDHAPQDARYGTTKSQKLRCEGRGVCRGV